MMASICSVSYHWFRSLGDSLVRELELRGDHLCLAAEETIIATGNLFSGTALGLYSLATLGFRPYAIELSRYRLSEARKIVSLPYIHILFILNPRALVPELSDKDHWGEGNLRDICLAADRSAHENSFLSRHIVARVQYGIYGICAVALRLAQGAIGTIAALLSLCTLGQFSFLNRVAYHGLEFPLVFRDIFFSAIKCLHPR